ncbi:MAG: IS4 family transposase [Thermoanaerobaculia bacterium]
MADSVRGVRKAGAAAPGTREERIDLLGTAKLLQEGLTEAACRAVFLMTRTTERAREWTLKALADFWTAVVLRAPPSLTAALVEAQESEVGGWPEIPATSRQGFFRRCKDLSWEFFAGLFREFEAGMARVAEAVFVPEMAGLRERFAEVWAIDGSRLDAVAHRLKILWDVRSPVLPGCLEVCYDLFRGIPRVVLFHPDAAEAEMRRAEAVLPRVPAGSLLLGDRLYASVKLFHSLSERDVYGLFRRNRTISLRKLRCLRRRRAAEGVLEDWLVEAGSGQTAPVQELRLILFRGKGKARRELLTNDLDPQHLAAEEALDLYPFRWTIERMYFDLKEVLDLHCFYAGNPNAVAMQVYAAAMVYAAMRVAQGRAAREAGVAPEAISTAKLFPKVAAASYSWTIIQLTVDAMRRANPGVPLRTPDWRRRAFASVPLSAVAVEPRKGKRRKRRFCDARRHWKSFAHVPGGPTLIRELS